MLIIVFIASLVSTVLCITGGHGMLLMPSLLLLGYNLKEIIVLIRVSAVVFVLFNLLGVVKLDKIPPFDKRDILIIAIACISVMLSVELLVKLNPAQLTFMITGVLVALFIFVVFKPVKWQYHDTLLNICLPIFAGICGSTIGGAGLIICTLYMLTGCDHVEAVKKRIIPSLIVQIVACLSLFTQKIPVDLGVLMTVLFATAIGGYLSMKLFFSLNELHRKILFYVSFVFSIISLLKDAISKMLLTSGVDLLTIIKHII